MDIIDKQSALLNSLIESLGNAVLLLTQEGKIIYKNSEAERIFQAVGQSMSSSTLVPEKIWRVCCRLIEGHNRRPDYSKSIESEVCLDKRRKFRVRVKWHSFEEQQLCLFVMIENQYQSLENQAVFEANEYRLTPAETRGWMLRRTNHTCKEIGNSLYITLNTVKKHLKNIKVKQEIVFDEKNYT